MRAICFLLVFAGFSLDVAAAPKGGDTSINSFAEGFIKGYLDWRPAEGVSLGLHQYDGRITDFSRASLEAELTRLTKAQQALAALPTNNLTRQGSCDYRLLQSAVRKEIFKFQDLQSYTRNPMTYARSMDVNIYIKRDFAPLPERVRSIIAILRQAPNVFAAARANLEEIVPRPFVETAIQIAEGSAEFLAKDLVTALNELKDESLQAQFKTA